MLHRNDINEFYRLLTWPFNRRSRILSVSPAAPVQSQLPRAILPMNLRDEQGASRVLPER